jgi:ABC-2 type transport system permease protein
MIIIIIIAMLVSNNNTLGNISGVVDVKEMISTNIFLVLSIACALSSTTHASISLEGKSLWIMKSIPVKVDTIFLSKIMVNLTLLIPVVLVGATFFGIYLHLSLFDMILLYLLPLAYSLFAAVMGLILNLMFPKFDFDNEIRVIKQSLPVFLIIMIGFVAIILPFTIFGNKILLITIVMVIIDIALFIILHFYGGRKFVRL